MWNSSIIWDFKIEKNELTEINQNSFIEYTYSIYIYIPFIYIPYTYTLYICFIYSGIDYYVNNYTVYTGQQSFTPPWEIWAGKVQLASLPWRKSVSSFLLTLSSIATEARNKISLFNMQKMYLAFKCFSSRREAIFILALSSLWTFSGPTLYVSLYSSYIRFANYPGGT